MAPAVHAKAQARINALMAADPSLQECWIAVLQGNAGATLTTAVTATADTVTTPAVASGAAAAEGGAGASEQPMSTTVTAVSAVAASDASEEEDEIVDIELIANHGRTRAMRTRSMLAAADQQPSAQQQQQQQEQQERLQQLQQRFYQCWTQCAYAEQLAAIEEWIYGEITAHLESQVQQLQRMQQAQQTVSAQQLVLTPSTETTLTPEQRQYLMQHQQFPVNPLQQQPQLMVQESMMLQAPKPVQRGRQATGATPARQRKAAKQEKKLPISRKASAVLAYASSGATDMTAVVKKTQKTSSRLSADSSAILLVREPPMVFLL